MTGRYRHKRTGRSVSEHFAKRHPNDVEPFGAKVAEERPDGGSLPAARRIAFRIERDVVLEELWFDQGWYDELLAEGNTPEDALRRMVELGMEEDGILVLWEAFGPGSEFAKSLTNLRLVTA